MNAPRLVVFLSKQAKIQGFPRAGETANHLVEIEQARKNPSLSTLILIFIVKYTCCMSHEDRFCHAGLVHACPRKHLCCFFA